MNEQALDEVLETEARTTYQRVFVAGWNAGEAEARSGALIGHLICAVAGAAVVGLAWWLTSVLR